MLVFIDNGAECKKSINIALIETVGPVSELDRTEDKKRKKFYFFSINGSNIDPIISRSYSTREEAEMVQYSVVTLLNALEVFSERTKHVPEDRMTPVYFQVIDQNQKKLVPGKITLYDQPVYTIVI